MTLHEYMTLTYEAIGPDYQIGRSNEQSGKS